MIIIDPIQWKILLHLAISMALGALLGFEREASDKPAGLRTHILVAGASALLVMLGQLTVDTFGSEFGGGLVSSDPIRVIAAVITGVSFLGAGTIIRPKKGSQVEGLTTAASLLFTSGVGISVALSQWVLAGGATVMALIALRGIPFIRRLFIRLRG